MKGLPLAYNKDMQETQEPAFQVEFVAPMLELVARFTAALKFNFERMREAAQTGYLNAMAGATVPGAQRSSLPDGAREDRQCGSLRTGKGRGT